MVTRERAACVAFWLAQGCALSVPQVADRTGLTYDGALKLLKTISRVIPISENNGIWCKITE